LAFATGKLGGAALGEGAVEADEGEDFAHAVGDVAARVAVDLQGFRHDLGDGHPRVEGGRGVLEDHLEVAAEREPLLRGEGGRVVAEDGDPAVGGAGEFEDFREKGGFSCS